MVCMAVEINLKGNSSINWRKKLMNSIESGELGIDWEYLLEAETDDKFCFDDDIDLRENPYHLFFHAVTKGHTALVSFFVENGLVDVDFRDSLGRTALDCARKCRRYEAVHCLIHSGATG